MKGLQQAAKIPKGGGYGSGRIKQSRSTDPLLVMRAGYFSNFNHVSIGELS